MKRTINFTARKKIPKDCYVIKVLRNSDGHVIGLRSGTQVDLSGLGLPDGCEVYIQIYRRSDSITIPLEEGQDHKYRLIRDKELGDIALGDSPLFRIVAVDEDGRVLAHARGLRVKEALQRRSLLPVEFVELGRLPWKLIIEGEEGPVLLINKNIPNIDVHANKNPLFCMLVYPQVLRQILFHMVFVNRLDDLEDPSVEWHRRWLRFAQFIVGKEETPAIRDANEDEWLEWIDKVVEEFCNRRSDWWKGLASELDGGLND